MTKLETAISSIEEQLKVIRDLSAQDNKSPSIIVKDRIYKEIEIGDVVQRFVYIKPGKFLMGSPESEKDRYDDEVQHEVILTKGYWLAETACTQALWKAVMGNNPSKFKEDLNNPVENVSWDDAMEFIKKLNKLKPSLNLRLPTEAEWEYACRAGARTPFSFGENITPEEVNYDGQNPYSGGKKGMYRKKTVTVKSLPCNQWGLYEMHGNVWEWCSDYWIEKHSTSSVIDPTGPSDGDNRVFRGGGWFSFGGLVRSARRRRRDPGNRDDWLGLRLSMSVE